MPPPPSPDTPSPSPNAEDGGDRLAAIHALRLQPVVRKLVEVAAALPGDEGGGRPLHLVGGILRDAWLGRPTHDVDVVVAGDGRELAERWAAALPARLVPLGGEEFAALRLVGEDAAGEGFEVDLWDRREMSLEEDLARRDVTVNALALDLTVPPPAGLEDPFGGLEDLAARRLRAVTEPTFREDPLRVVRLARLTAELAGFRVEPATAELARLAATRVSLVAAERVRVELERLFAAPGAPRGLEVLARVDLYPGLAWPMTTHWPPSGDPDAAALAARWMEALPRAAARLRRRSRAAGLGEVEMRTDLAHWAAALHALPTPAPEDTVVPVDDVRKEALDLLGHRRWASRRTLEPVGRLLAHPPASIGAGDAGTRTAAERWWLHRLGDLWPTALAWWGARVVGRREPGGEPEWRAAADRLLAHLAEDAEGILDPSPLLRGDEVAELTGVEPGPELGRILAAVRRAQVEGRVTDQRGAELEARRLARGSG